jgi:DNA-binding MarR family transcriptional regulator
MVQPTIRCPVVDDPTAALVPDLYRVVRRLRRISDSPALDVTTLMLLHRLGAGGAARPSDLAAELGLALSTISRHARALGDLGLVSRDPDPEDGRSLQLSLTQAGADHMTDAFRRREDAVARATTGWDASDVDALRALLARLATDLDHLDLAQEHR